VIQPTKLMIVMKLSNELTLPTHKKKKRPEWFSQQTSNIVKHGHWFASMFGCAGVTCPHLSHLSQDHPSAAKRCQSMPIVDTLPNASKCDRYVWHVLANMFPSKKWQTSSNE